MIKILQFLPLCCVILIMSPARGIAAAPLPTTPAGAALGAWLTAFNSGDAVLLKAFNDSYSTDVKVEDSQKLRSTNGGFILMRITSDEKLRVQAILKDNNAGQRWQIAITLNENKPSSVASIWLATGSAPLPK